MSVETFSFPVIFEDSKISIIRGNRPSQVQKHRQIHTYSRRVPSTPHLDDRPECLTFCSLVGLETGK